jgi:autotransporter-associated beta strand protein
MKKALLAVTVITSLGTAAIEPVGAQTTKYWDINGTTAGASGGATATGAWNSTATNWNTDSTGGAGGAISAWTGATDTAVFSASTNATGASTITATGTPVAAGITIEEGSITLSGRVDVNTGTVELKSGTLLSQASSGGATGTGITLTAGGKYAITGNATLRQTNAGTGGSFISSVGVIQLSNNAILTVDYTTANSLSIIQTASNISGTGSLVKEGAGVIAIASVGSYTGSTTVNAGELRIRTTANRLPVGTDMIVNTPGILNLNGIAQQVGSLSGNGQVGLSGATLTVSGSGSTTFTGQIKNVANAGAGAVTTGNGRLTKSGSGTLTLSGINDYKGRTTITAGGIIVSPGASLSDAIADLFVDGGTITFNNTAQTVENLDETTDGVTTGTVVLGSGHTLTTDPAASTAFFAKISGAGNLVKANVLSGATNRTLTLRGDNDYTGNTTVAGGILSVGHANALGTTAGFTEVASGAEVLFTGAATNFTVAEPFRISGTGPDGGAIAVQASASPTLSGPVTLVGNATITVSGPSSVTFSNPAAITSSAGQNLTLAGAGNGTISGAVDLGTGSLTKNQSGIWRLNNPTGNTYSGGTIISSGVLEANNTSGSATGSGAVTVNGGALAGTGSVSGAVTVNAGGSVSPGTSIETLDTGALTFNNDGTLDYEIDSSAGSLTVAADLVDSTGGLTIVSGADLTVDDIAATDQLLPTDTKFTLIRYDSTAGFTGPGFQGLPQGATFFVGPNRFWINYIDSTGGVNFGGGTGGGMYVTITANTVPEASAFLFGGLAITAAGVGKIVARRRRPKSEAC